METSVFINCPVCGGKTRSRITAETVLIKFPLFCPKCKNETVINAEKFNITVVKEPDAKTQSR